MKSKTRVAKWGTSLAVRIPKPVLEAAHLREGDSLSVEVEDGKIVIRPVRHRPTLTELVNGVTPENRHSETDWGKPRGNEVW